jgi:Autotransporter beta-domain
LTTGGTASSGPISLPPGTYTVTELQNNAYFSLTDITCNDPDGGTRVNTATATAVIDLDAGENIVCTFTNLDPRPQTKAVIERFLHNRLTALLDDDPDRARFLRRYPSSLWGGGPGANSSPFNFAASEKPGGQMSFSTSLSQIRSAIASADKANQQHAMTLGSAALNERPGPAPYRGIDIWTEGHFTGFNDDIGNANADGNFDILYVGGDYPLTQNILVGMLGQFDWANEHTKIDSSKTEGNGWMVGPYVSARLDQNLFFDWRAAWGRSDNSVNPFGTYTDNFDTSRWLTTARWRGGPGGLYRQPRRAHHQSDRLPRPRRVRT